MSIAALAPVLPYIIEFIRTAIPEKSSAARASSCGVICAIAAIMLATVSPVMVGAEAASPQPTKPPSDSMRTITLSARATGSPAIWTGFFIGKLIAIGSIALIFTMFLVLLGRRDKVETDRGCE